MGRPPFDPNAPPEVLEAEPVAPRPPAPRRWPPPAELRGRRRLAWTIAIAADALQWVLFPLVMEGLLSPVNDVLDVLVGGVMVWLLGWHLAFLPSFVMKLVPMVDLVPTWTAAVWIATRKPLPAEPPAAAGPGAGAPRG